jgi:diguanylate cyclase (GGDEF)-like protein/PAS domain S-box-containing protein
MHNRDSNNQQEVMTLQGSDAHSTPILRKQIKLTFQRSLPVALAQIGAALLLAVVLRQDSDTSLLLSWLGVLLPLQLLWLGFMFAHARSTRSRRGAPQWLQAHCITTSFIALAWGLGPGLLLFPLEPLQQLLVVVVVAGIAASGLIIHTFSRWGGPVFLWSALAPMAVGNLLMPDSLHIILGGLLLLYGLLLAMILRQFVLTAQSTLNLNRENAELELEAQAYRAFFSQAQQLAHLGSWALDLKTGELQWSDEAFALFGLEPQTLTKQVLLKNMYPADREKYVRAFEEALAETSMLTREFRVNHPDGSLRVLRDTGEVLIDEEGEAVRMLGVMYDITDWVTAEQETRNAYSEFNRILTHMQDTYYRADPAGRITQLSRSVEKLLGYLPEQCVGMRIADLYAIPRHGQAFLSDLHGRGGSLRNYEIQMRHKEGESVWVSLNAQFIYDNKGNTTGIEGTIRDITELKRAQEALHQEKELALVTLQSIGDGVITTDDTGQIQYLNPSAERLLGIAAEQAGGSHYRDVLKLVDEATGESLDDLVRICLMMESGSAHADEGLLLRADGTRYHLKVTAAPMHDHYGHVVGAVLVLHDITEVMGMARQLSYQASHDMLTGLYNRRVFEQRVEEAIRHAQEAQEIHSLLYLDLDQFKVVNDTCGHHAGDELLQQVSQLMLSCVRETDTLARLGGDEFGVLLEHCPLQKAEQIADTIRLAVHDFRFAWDDKAFEIGVSIGVVPIAEDSGNLATVLAAADAACYVAKDSGRNRLHVYQPDDDAVLQRHGEMQWVHRLSSAFDTGSFQLYAQPIAHVAGDRVVSHYEILVRMLDESGRIVPPGAFIPAAERYNLMPMIDRWVIRNTLEMLRDAQGELAFPPVECAINLSGQSLTDDRFLEYVVDLFDETGIPCESISFEVTETAAVANLSRATRFISVLRGMGCSFALDDFGAGLSSFGYLKNLPVDYLKIDGGFVRDMVRDQVDRAMVESINEIGHIMGLKTIGEYAEDERALLALERAGVDFAQGNAIAAPQAFSVVLESESRLQRRAVSSAG